ncbi:hypothetical protein DIE28_15140, partial [Paracoccus thiocyanatus]
MAHILRLGLPRHWRSRAPCCGCRRRAFWPGRWRASRRANRAAALAWPALGVLALGVARAVLEAA